MVSPNSDDHKGATAFFERFAPEVELLAQDQDVLLASTLHPMNVIPPRDSRGDFLAHGIDPILALRATPEFGSLQQARLNLLSRYRSLAREKTASHTAITQGADERFQQALALYLGVVADGYGLGDAQDEASLQSLKKLIARSSRKIEETKEKQTRNRWLYAVCVIPVFITALTSIGIPPHAIWSGVGATVVTGGLSLAAFLGQRRIMNRLTNNRRLLENAGRLLNLKHVSEAREEIPPGGQGS